MNELEALVRLNLSGMVGSSILRRLLEQHPLDRIHRLSPRELERVPGIGPVTARAIASAPPPGPELERAAKAGVSVLGCLSPDYPAALRELYDHPVVLYRRGTWSGSDALAAGVVGSRDCTDYGRRQAERFGRDLASVGVTVVSGLARGIDTAAHRGALRAPGGRTAAMLGSGLLKAYPSENARLLDAICERGAAFSEFPLLQGPEPLNFPRRNRLISGMSMGVLVVEAADRSGALITADWALEQGRDVFCLPGSVESPLSRGCHRLIRQGAKLVEEPADLLEEVPAFAGLAAPAPALTALERAVLRSLGRRPATAEELAARTRLPLSSLERTLPELARKGLAAGDPRGAFVLHSAP